jgi:hypothetical protein
LFELPGVFIPGGSHALTFRQKLFKKKELIRIIEKEERAFFA